MIVAPGSTSVSIDIEFVDDGNIPLTGKVKADFPPIYGSTGARATASLITLSDLVAIDSAFSDGGIKERSGTSGVYRFDVPDAFLATAGRVLIYGDTSGKRVIAPEIDVQYLGSDTFTITGSTGDTFIAGEQVVQDVTAATGMAISNNTAQLILRGMVGVPDDSRVWRGQVSAGAFTPSRLPVDIRFAGFLTGSGQYPIDHDGGTGAASADIAIYIPYSAGSSVGSSANVLKYTSNGTTGVSGLTIRAYLASDYDANARAALGTTYTKADGRWTAPLMLNSGTYYLIADAQADGYAANQIKVVVP